MTDREFSKRIITATRIQKIRNELEELDSDLVSFEELNSNLRDIQEYITPGIPAKYLPSSVKEYNNIVNKPTEDQVNDQTNNQATGKTNEHAAPPTEQ